MILKFKNTLKVLVFFNKNFFYYVTLSIPVLTQFFFIGQKNTQYNNKNVINNYNREI